MKESNKNSTDINLSEFDASLQILNILKSEVAKAKNSQNSNLIKLCFATLRHSINALNSETPTVAWMDNEGNFISDNEKKSEFDYSKKFTIPLSLNKVTIPGQINTDNIKLLETERNL